MPTQFKKGDRVKVTLEGEVANARDLGEVVELRVSSNGLDNYVYTDSATIEKVDLPVEVFGPGDVVRNTRHGGLDRAIRVLADDGYITLPLGEFFKYGVDGGLPRDRFTSENYERVDLS